jgi:putative spermidine/putrescine transport system ATP-binding protein
MSLVFDQVGFAYAASGQGLQDISFEVARGELVAVIGPSGSGKSTLLKLVSGLERGHSGRVLLDGADLSPLPVHLRRMGMVFQNYALFPHMHVLDNIAYGLKLRGVDAGARRAKAMELLDMVGMPDMHDRSVRQLSGGQQQRVALARALAIDPQALLLDEPLSALDASIRGHLRDQIRVLQKRLGITTLLVTHDQEEALVMADKVAVLKDGRLLQIDTPHHLYEAPATTTVAAFVGLSTIWAVTVSAPDWIDTGFAQIKTDTGHRPIGARVHMLVRPEHVQPDPPHGTPNRLEGHPGTTRFLGAVSRYDFHVRGASQPALSESRQVATHAIALPPEHIRLLDQ